MVNYKIKDLRGPQRRTFLGMMGAVAAGFALERSKLLNFLLDQGGSAMADEACSETNRHVGIVSGGGNYCLWQLLFPVPEVGAANNAVFAYHAPGMGVHHNSDKPQFVAGPADRPFFYGPQAPFYDTAMMAPTYPMTALLTADPVVHHRKPLRQVTIDGPLPGNAQGANDGGADGSVTLFAAISAIQRSTVSILPSIGIAPAAIGNAPGAPGFSVVPTAGAMVDLFNSAAAQKILKAEGDKAMYETYYKAILGLRDAAGRPTWSRELETTKSAANLIGRNLADALMPQPADRTLYGIPEIEMAKGSFFGGAGGADRLINMALGLITTVKAFQLGLTNQVIIGVPAESGGGNFTDPHGAFDDDLPGSINTVTMFARFLNSFYAQLAAIDDPACTSKKLDKTTILTVHGDHPHDPLKRPAWPDSTPGGCNWMFVMGGGYLPSGWHGWPKIDNTCDGIDPTTGLAMPYNATAAAHASSAAVLYAVAKGDMKKVDEFYKGPAITALVNKV
jgi:hypothetical protein